MLRRLNICPNAYYNFLKNRKAEYHQQKEVIKKEISDIYHAHGGVDGYLIVHAYLVRIGIRKDIRKMMNKDVGDVIRIVITPLL